MDGMADAIGRLELVADRRWSSWFQRAGGLLGVVAAAANEAVRVAATDAATEELGAAGRWPVKGRESPADKRRGLPADKVSVKGMCGKREAILACRGVPLPNC